MRTAPKETVGWGGGRLAVLTHHSVEPRIVNPATVLTCDSLRSWLGDHCISQALEWDNSGNLKSPRQLTVDKAWKEARNIVASTDGTKHP